MKPHLFFSCFSHTSQILHVVNKFGSDHVITYTRSTVSGTITDFNGIAIHGAVVFISTVPGMNTVTDTGVYTFEDIPAGMYNITVIAPNDDTLTKAVTVPNGDYNLTFEPEPIISGIVTYADGPPVPNANVTLSVYDETTRLDTTTDNNGRYSFDDNSLYGKKIVLFVVPDGDTAADKFQVLILSKDVQTFDFTLTFNAPTTPIPPATPPTPPTPPSPSRDKIIIDICGRDVFNFPRVTGTFTASADYSLVGLRFNVLDENERILDTTIDLISDIKTGETSTFDIKTYSYRGDFHSCHVEVTDRFYER